MMNGTVVLGGVAFGGMWLFAGVLLLALLIASFMRLRSGHRRRRDNAFNAGRRQDALDAARQRLAKGEISREEFEALKRDPE